YVWADSYNGLNADQPLPGSVRSELARVPGVRFVSPVNTVWVQLGGQAASMYVYPVSDALRAHDPGAIGGADLAEDPHGFLQGLGQGEVALSRYTAERLGVESGGSIALSAPPGRRGFSVATI